jgi:hypothetical protein
LFRDALPIEELPYPRAKAARQVAQATRRRLAGRANLLALLPVSAVA